MSFICPVCKKSLTREERCYRCDGGHLFDIARSGYVNLLTPDKMNSLTPGDNKEMVSSRRDFLMKGYYAPLLENIIDVAGRCGGEVYFDAGCGTGYYTKGVADSLGVRAIGVDISKNAVNTSAKYLKSASFAVASVYDLPLKSESVDLITNIFSPMADREYMRVLKKGGHLIYVVPAPEHLYALKTLLYDTPYLNTDSDICYEGFREIEKREVTFDISLSSSEDIMALFKMTPYSWRTPEGAEEKIKATPFLKDKASFYILVLEKC